MLYSTNTKRNVQLPEFHSPDDDGVNQVLIAQFAPESHIHPPVTSMVSTFGSKSMINLQTQLPDNPAFAQDYMLVCDWYSFGTSIRTFLRSTADSNWYAAAYVPESILYTDTSQYQLTQKCASHLSVWSSIDSVNQTYLSGQMTAATLNYIPQNLSQLTATGLTNLERNKCCQTVIVSANAGVDLMMPYADNNKLVNRIQSAPSGTIQVPVASLATQEVIYNVSLQPSRFNQGTNNFVLDSTQSTNFVNKLGLFELDINMGFANNSTVAVWVDINMYYIDAAGNPQSALQVQIANINNSKNYSGQYTFQPFNVIQSVYVYTVPFTPMTSGTVKIKNYGCALDTLNAPVSVIIMEALPVSSVIAISGASTYRCLPGANSQDFVTTEMPSDDDVLDLQVTQKVLRLISQLTGFDSAYPRDVYADIRQQILNRYGQRRMHHALLGQKWKDVLRRVGRVVSKGIGAGLKIAGAIEPELLPITAPLGMINHQIQRNYLAQHWVDEPEIEEDHLLTNWLANFREGMNTLNDQLEPQDWCEDAHPPNITDSGDVEKNPGPHGARDLTRDGDVEKNPGPNSLQNMLDQFKLDTKSFQERMEHQVHVEAQETLALREQLKNLSTDRKKSDAIHKLVIAKLTNIITMGRAFNALARGNRQAADYSELQNILSEQQSHIDALRQHNTDLMSRFMKIKLKGAYVPPTTEEGYVAALSASHFMRDQAHTEPHLQPNAADYRLIEQNPEVHNEAVLAQVLVDSLITPSAAQRGESFETFGAEDDRSEVEEETEQDILDMARARNQTAPVRTAEVESFLTLPSATSTETSSPTRALGSVNLFEEDPLGDEPFSLPPAPKFIPVLGPKPTATLDMPSLPVPQTRQEVRDSHFPAFGEESKPLGGMPFTPVAAPRAQTPNVNEDYEFNLQLFSGGDQFQKPTYGEAGAPRSFLSIKESALIDPNADPRFQYGQVTELTRADDRWVHMKADPANMFNLGQNQFVTRWAMALDLFAKEVKPHAIVVHTNPAAFFPGHIQDYEYDGVTVRVNNLYAYDQQDKSPLPVSVMHQLYLAIKKMNNMFDWKCKFICIGTATPGYGVSFMGAYHAALLNLNSKHYYTGAVRMFNQFSGCMLDGEDLNNVAKKMQYFLQQYYPHKETPTDVRLVVFSQNGDTLMSAFQSNTGPNGRVGLLYSKSAVMLVVSPDLLLCNPAFVQRTVREVTPIPAKLKEEIRKHTDLISTALGKAQTIKVLTDYRDTAMADDVKIATVNFPQGDNGKGPSVAFTQQVADYERIQYLFDPKARLWGEKQYTQQCAFLYNQILSTISKRELTLPRTNMMSLHYLGVIGGVGEARKLLDELDDTYFDYYQEHDPVGPIKATMPYRLVGEANALTEELLEIPQHKPVMKVDITKIKTVSNKLYKDQVVEYRDAKKIKEILQAQPKTTKDKGATMAQKFAAKKAQKTPTVQTFTYDMKGPAAQTFDATLVANKFV